MASHAQLDNVIVVSYAGPPKSAAPLDGSSGIATLDTVFFSSIETLDQALLDDVGTSQTNIDRMSVNDKVYAVRIYLENGGVLTSLAAPLPTHVESATSPTTEVDAWGTVWLNTTTQQVYQTPGDGTWALLIDFA